MAANSKSGSQSRSRSHARSHSRNRGRSKTRRKNLREEEFKIDWPFVGKLIVGGLILAALSGRLGPKAFVMANLAKKLATGGLV